MNDSRRPSPAMQMGLALLLGLSILLTYVDRGAVSTAAPRMNGELGLDEATFGFVVSAFFWSYTPLQLVIGWMCDRFSVYKLFGWGVALWALSTVLTGFVSGFALLLVLRLLLGAGEAICFPGASKIIARHVAPERRGISNAIVVAGVAFGPAVGTLIGGGILATWGWRPIFWIFGVATLLWLLPWAVLSRRLADAHPAEPEAPYPMLGLLQFRALWTVSLGHFCANFVIYFIIAWLPLYLTKSRGLPVGEMTLLASATFLAQGLAAIFAGYLSDRWTAAGHDEGQTRRWLSTGGALISALGIVAVSRIEGVPGLLACLVITGAACGVVSSNIFSIAQIFAGPRLAGSWIGVQNFFANLAGILAPSITGVMIARTGSYGSAFALAAAVAVMGAAAWHLLMPRVEPVRA